VSIKTLPADSPSAFLDFTRETLEILQNVEKRVHHKSIQGICTSVQKRIEGAEKQERTQAIRSFLAIDNIIQVTLHCISKNTALRQEICTSLLKIKRTRAVAIKKEMKGFFLTPTIQYAWNQAAVTQENLEIFLSSHNDQPKDLSRLIFWQYTGELRNSSNMGTRAKKGVCFSQYFCRGKDFSKSDLNATIFSKADLEEASMEGSYLMGTEFKRANMKKMNLKRTQMHGADLSHANLEGAHLDHAILIGSRFTTRPIT